MPDIQQLIAQAQAVMTCPVCGRHFEAEEITFKGFMEHTYILQTSCSAEHPAVFTTWVTSYMPTQTQDTSPITNDHVLALHQALQHFNGDFKALWSKKGS